MNYHEKLSDAEIKSIKTDIHRKYKLHEAVKMFPELIPTLTKILMR